MLGLNEVPVVSARLARRDVFGAWKVRWGLGRDRYTVSPGLFCCRETDSGVPRPRDCQLQAQLRQAPRRASRTDAWILVLDTKGVNVWCAAGKGTFGTRELEMRILQHRLEEVVSHRTLILPQLGATGVSAPRGQKDTGWRVVFGPVRARDIPAFLANGIRKEAAMRRVEFRLTERMAVAPMELVQSWPFLLGGSSPPRFSLLFPLVPVTCASSSASACP